jgi:hypothetical protein
MDAGVGLVAAIGCVCRLTEEAALLLQLWGGVIMLDVEEPGRGEGRVLLWGSILSSIFIIGFVGKGTRVLLVRCSVGQRTSLLVYKCSSGVPRIPSDIAFQLIKE